MDESIDVEIRRGELAIKATEAEIKAREAEIKAREVEVKFLDLELKRREQGTRSAELELRRDQAEGEDLLRAILFVRCHVPAYGERPIRVGESWIASDKPAFADVPSRVGIAVEDAVLAAAEYVELSFQARADQMRARRSGARSLDTPPPGPEEDPREGGEANPRGVR